MLNFKSKLSDANSKNSETQLWLEFAIACGYIDAETKIKLENKSIEIGKLINFMMNNPDKFGATS